MKFFNVLLVLLILGCGGSSDSTGPQTFFPVVGIETDTVDLVAEKSVVTVTVYDSVEVVSLPQVAVTFHIVRCSSPTNCAEVPPSAANGTVYSGVALTNNQGKVQEQWTLGTLAGEQTLEARAIVQGVPTLFGRITKQVRPDTVSQLSVDTLPVRLMVGDTFVVRRRVGVGKDMYGNLVPTYTPSYQLLGAGSNVLRNDTLLTNLPGSFVVRVQFAGTYADIPVTVYPAYLSAFNYLVTYQCDSTLTFTSPVTNYKGYSSVSFTGVKDSLILQGSPSYSNGIGGKYQVFLTFQQQLVFADGEIFLATVQRQLGVTIYTVDSTVFVYRGRSLGTAYVQPNGDLVGPKFCTLTDDQFLHEGTVQWLKQ